MNNLVLLNAGYAADDDRWNFSHVSSIFFRAYYVTEGQATVHLQTRDLRLQAGHIYIIPALMTHDERSHGTFRHIYLHFMDRDNSLINMAYEYEMMLDVVAKPDDLRLFRRLLDLYPDYGLPTSTPEVYDTSPTTLAAARRFAASDLSHRLEAEGILMQLMARFLKGSKPHHVGDQRIREAVVWIEQHLDSGISVDRLAQVAALSKERFIRLFHREMGCPPMVYVTKRRIFRAMLLLGRADGQRKSIKEVGYAVGFDNANYFSRVFRKVAGISPSEFAQANR